MNLLGNVLLQNSFGKALLLTTSLLVFAGSSEANSWSFAQVIEHALENNPELKAGEHRGRSLIDRGDAAGYWPQPELRGNYFGKPIETRLGAQEANVSIVQALPVTGKYGARSRTFKYAGDAQLLKVASLKRSLRAELVALGDKIYAAQMRINFNDSERRFLGDLTDIALAKVKVGKGHQQDVASAALETSLLEEKNQMIRQQMRSWQLRVLEIANLPEQTSVNWPISFSQQSNSRAKKGEGTERSFQLALKKNPGLLAARKKVESAEESLVATRREVVPDLKLIFSWFSIDEDSAATPKGKNEDAWSVGVAFTVPLWAGRYGSANDSAYQQKVADMWDLKTTERKLRSDLTDLWQQINSTREVIRLYDSTIIPQSEQIMSTNLSSYRQGKSGFEKIIQDFRTLLKHKENYYIQRAKLGGLVAKLEALEGD